MNPQRFFIPGYMGMRNVPLSNPAIGFLNSAPRGTGFFSKITNSIRSINWGGILNNANKTLNVVNQAIPLVRQAGPMVNNMRSILRIAKAFGSETTNKSNRKHFNNNLNTNNDTQNINNNDNLITKKEVIDDNSPNFFV